MIDRVAPTIGELTNQTMGQYQRGEVHDVDFAVLRRFLRPDTDVLDVGANRGQSMVSLWALQCPARIHAFEANPMLHPVLDAVAPHCGATVHPFGLSDADATLQLLVPWAGGDCFLEEASMQREYFELPWVAEKFQQRGGLHLETVDIQVRVGDQLQLRPSVIKVDVEGAELRVIKGLWNTVRTHRPAILAENSDYQNVTELLNTADYLPFMVVDGEIMPLSRACTNTLYLPREVTRDITS